jgi:hypothetical protein
MLVVTHQICSPILKPEEVWKMVNEYFGREPNRDLRPDGLESLSSLVRKAALARYPCPPSDKH